MKNKRIIAISLTCISMIGILSGCGKKMDYDTTKLEGYFDEASNYSEIYKSKLEHAVAGQLDEMVEGANDVSELLFNNKDATNSEIVTDDNGISRKKVEGILPDLIIMEKDIDTPVETKTESVKFLSEDFEATSYRGERTHFNGTGSGYVAWKYEKQFMGTMSHVYDEFFKLVSKVDEQYKNAKYFDESYMNASVRGFSEIKDYRTLYKVNDGRFYVLAKCITQFDPNKDVSVQSTGTYQLWFIDSQKHQDLNNKEFGNENPLGVFKKMVEDEKIPSDFNLKMFIVDNELLRYLDELHPRYGYGKATSPSYKGVFDLTTLAPGESPEPEPTPEPTPEPEIIVDDLIIDDGTGEDTEQATETTEPITEPETETGETMEPEPTEPVEQTQPNEPTEPPTEDELILE